MAVTGYVSVICGIFLGDMWVKNRIEKCETDRSGNILQNALAGEGKAPKTLWGGRILLRKHHNKGAMLNLGQGRSKAVTALSLALSAVVAVMFLCSLGKRGNGLLRTGLAMLLGGAFSNTYDRLKRRYVVDYLTFSVGWKPLRQVIFNLSDFCIMIGALLIVLGVR